MATLEQVGEEVVGQARCPFESRQSNVGLFAGELAELRSSGEKHDLTFNLANNLLTFHKVQLLLLQCQHTYSLRKHSVVVKSLGALSAW